VLNEIRRRQLYTHSMRTLLLVWSEIDMVWRVIGRGGFGGGEMGWDWVAGDVGDVGDVGGRSRNGRSIS